MALQTLLLVGPRQGVPILPNVGFEIEAVAKLVSLPDDHIMGPMVAVGKGIKDTRPKPGQLSLGELVFENTF